MRQRFFIPVVFLGLMSTQAFAGELEKADAFYDQGDCKSAIATYQSVSASGVDSATGSKVTFRTAYCQFALGEYKKAEGGFESYLKSHPKDDEARLKLSQSLFFQEKYPAALTAAQQVQPGDHFLEAAIVRARVAMETDKLEKALQILTPLSSEKDHFEVQYWLAVAQYRADEDVAALQTFKIAEKNATNDHWVKNESKAWIERLENEKRRLHVQLTVGGFTDSNISQSGSSVTIAEGGGGPGGPTKPDLSSGVVNYISDNGQYASLDLIHNTYVSRKSYLTTTLSYSSPYFSKYISYGMSSSSLDLSWKRLPSNEWSYGISLKYLTTAYSGIYYQDYLSSDPFISWAPSAAWWMKFSTPVTSYLNNKKISIIAPSLDFYYEAAAWVGFSFGGSVSKSTGPTAVIVDLPPPTLQSGSIFSRYTTTGGYVGTTINFSETLHLSLTESVYRTAYESENLPPTIPPKQRTDNLTTHQVNLMKTLIKNLWSANLSYTFYDNKSEGFPGLASGATITTNTYTRQYILLTTTVYY